MFSAYDSERQDVQNDTQIFIFIMTNIFIAFDQKKNSAANNETRIF
jgi:hypothetical protein